MRIVMETLFDLGYLVLIFTLGIKLLKRPAAVETAKLFRLFGAAALILGAGDSFHLVPRVYALWNGGTAAWSELLGFGTLIASISMTIFYLFLYHVRVLWYCERHDGEGRPKAVFAAGFFVYVLALLRIVLCLLPQNRWFSADSPLNWGIYRNIPFTLMGILIAALWAKDVHFADRGRMGGGRPKDPFRFMPLAIILSFAFYLPVVLWASAVPALGALMIPKTLVYVWMVVMGLKAAQAL